MEFFHIFKDKIGNYLPKKHRRKKVILCIHIEVGKVISAKFFHVICLNCPILVAKWRKTWFCQQQQGEGETVCMCTFSRFCSLQFHFALRSAVRNERALDITLLHWEKQSRSRLFLQGNVRLEFQEISFWFTSRQFGFILVIDLLIKCQLTAVTF